VPHHNYAEVILISIRNRGTDRLSSTGGENHHTCFHQWMACAPFASAYLRSAAQQRMCIRIVHKFDLRPPEEQDQGGECESVMTLALTQIWLCGDALGTTISVQTTSSFVAPLSPPHLLPYCLYRSTSRRVSSSDHMMRLRFCAYNNTK
jgi:hypothetical protein